MKTNLHLRRDRDLGTKQTSRRRLVVTAGLWIEGKTYWVRNYYEKIIIEEGISIRVKEIPVHSQIDFLEVYIRNHALKKRRAKLLLKHHYPYPAEEHFAFTSPVEKVMFHTANNMIFLVNAVSNGKGVGQMTVLPHWHVNTEKIWSSPEKGILHYQPMAKGMMVSIFALDMDLPARGMCKGNSWIIKGDKKDELLRLNKLLLKSH